MDTSARLMPRNIARKPMIQFNKLVRASGIEPLTPTMSRWVRIRSNELI